MNTISKRFYTSTKSSLPKAGKTIWWLLKIILPISLIVSFLQYWGVIAQIASLLAPAFSLVGLLGESAIVFITSIFLPLYAPIAIIATLPMNMREITILAFMCLISHNLFVETAVQTRTGSSALIMFFLRLITSMVGAFILNLILPEHIGSNHIIQKIAEFTSIADMLRNWIVSAGFLALKISLIISGLMLLQSILKEFKILDIISKVFAPLMRIMGLSKDSSFLWFVAQTLGLAYGSAVMIDEVNNRAISLEDAKMLNYHIAINHSLLEDTLLFVAIGVPAGWIVAPRFILALLIVWSIKVLRKLRRKKEVENIIIQQ